MRRTTYDVEIHTGERSGLGAGPSTGTYQTPAEAIAVMAAATAAGHGATCIVRDAQGRGRIHTLGLAPAAR